MMCGLWIRWTPTKNNEVNPWLHPHSKPQMTPFHVCLSYFEAELMLIRLILFHQLIFVFVHLVDILCEAHLETLLSDHVTSLLLWSVFYSFLSHCVIFLLRHSHTQMFDRWSFFFFFTACLLSSLMSAVTPKSWFNLRSFSSPTVAHDLPCVLLSLLLCVCVSIHVYPCM